jgi:hypothetical protein
MRIIARTIVVSLLAAALVMIFMAPVVLAAPGAPGSGVNKELAAARRATTKYHDVNVALADGYVPVPPHVPGMGVHYANFPLLDAVFDIERPEILLYSMAEGNGPKLVAVEYVAVVPRPGFTGDSDLWELHPASCHYADGHEVEVPENGCPPFSPGGAPLALVHPDLFAVHAWIWRGNPDGIFAPFNPNVP